MISISDSAAERLKEMLAEQETPNMFLRLGVTAGGCSGFHMQWASTIKKRKRMYTWTCRI